MDNTMSFSEEQLKQIEQFKMIVAGMVNKSNLESNVEFDDKFMKNMIHVSLQEYC